MEGLIPPDGWHYMQKMADGRLVRVDGGTRDNLYDNVRDFRLANAIEVGNVIQDVDDFTCARAPTQCHGAGPSDIIQTYSGPQKGMRFIDKLTGWGNKMIRSAHISAVEPHEEAQRRARICIACPRNTEWRNSCGACVTTATRLFTMLSKGKIVKDVGDKLKGCTSFAHHNPTAVWLKAEAFDGVGVDVPSNCWVPKPK